MTLFCWLPVLCKWLKNLKYSQRSRKCSVSIVLKLLTVFKVFMHLTQCRFYLDYFGFLSADVSLCDNVQ